MRQRFEFAGAAVNMIRSIHHRNAASVFPVPVGARISVDSPRAIAGQPSIWGRVGSVKTASNQSRTAGWKSPIGLVVGAGSTRTTWADLFFLDKAASVKTP